MKIDKKLQRSMDTELNTIRRELQTLQTINIPLKAKFNYKNTPATLELKIINEKSLINKLIELRKKVWHQINNLI